MLRKKSKETFFSLFSEAKKNFFLFLSSRYYSKLSLSRFGLREQKLSDTFPPQIKSRQLLLVLGCFCFEGGNHGRAELSCRRLLFGIVVTFALSPTATFAFSLLHKRRKKRIFCVSSSLRNCQPALSISPIDLGI